MKNYFLSKETSLVQSKFRGKTHNHMFAKVSISHHLFLPYALKPFLKITVPINDTSWHQLLWSPPTKTYKGNTTQHNTTIAAKRFLHDK